MDSILVTHSSYISDSNTHGSAKKIKIPTFYIKILILRVKWNFWFILPVDFDIVALTTINFKQILLYNRIKITFMILRFISGIKCLFWNRNSVFIFRTLFRIINITRKTPFLIQNFFLHFVLKMSKVNRKFSSTFLKISLISFLKYFKTDILEYSFSSYYFFNFFFRNSQYCLWKCVVNQNIQT